MGEREDAVQRAVLASLDRSSMLNRHAIAHTIDGADGHDVERALQLLIQQRTRRS